MTSATDRICSGLYSHDALLHHGEDDDLVKGTRAFVEQGLATGGHVLVHGTEERVAMMRAELDPHPRLEYGLDRDLYASPSSTLFAYQRKMAESPEPIELWATGTVPMGDDPADHPAWARYESLVNEALGAYAFHGLCTYDTRTLPASTIATAKATHPWISNGADRTSSHDYLDPADFLRDPAAAVPGPPDSQPAVSVSLHSLRDLWRARHLLALSAVSASAVARDRIEDLITAVNEVLVNGLEHGGIPVQLVVWVETSMITCRITDSGAGIPDPLTGYRYPVPAGPRGLWLARQLCEDLFVSNQPDGGCSVLMTTT